MISDNIDFSQYCFDSFGFLLNKNHLSLFSSFFDMVIETNKKFNLTSITNKNEFYSRHFIDSLASVSFLKEGSCVCDVGSGAGFPCVPLSIVRNDVVFTAIDSMKKKTDFISSVAKSLGLNNLHSECGRVEEKKSLFGLYDIVCSRAVTSLPPLIEICFPLLKIGGLLIVYKTDHDDPLSCSSALSVMNGYLETVFSYSLPDKTKRNLFIYKKISLSPIKYPRSWGKIIKHPL